MNKALAALIALAGAAVAARAPVARQPPPPAPERTLDCRLDRLNRTVPSTAQQP